MKTRDGRVRTGHPELVGAGTSSGEQGTPTSAAQPPPPRRGPVVVLVVALAAALVATVLLAVLGGGDDDVATSPDPARGPAAQPQGPAALGLTVEAPESVVAGQPATFVVRWADGSGVFSGSSEDWGDGVGTSSLQQERCGPTAPAPDPAAGSYRAEHSWSEPGTYTVVIGVATYACENGSAVVEDASKTLTVEVLPTR
jgi:hypothetical protein